MVRPVGGVVKLDGLPLQYIQEDAESMNNLFNIICRASVIGLITGSLLAVSGCVYNQPRTHEDLIRYGVILAEKGYWSEAGMQWRMVLNEDPENVAALNNLGIAAEVLDGLDTADKFLIKALSLRPDDEQIKRNVKLIRQRSVEQKQGEGEDEKDE